MAALSTYVPDIRAHIPEIPSFVAERQLLRAAREFCEFTRAWRSSFNVSVVAGTATVSLAAQLPTNTELVDIIAMKPSDGSTALSPTTYKKLDADYSDWRDDSNDLARYFVIEGNNTVRLYPTPATTTSGLYHTRVAVKPLLTATSIDDLLTNKFREAIINGALSFLYMIPRKPWSDARLGAYFQNEFDNEKLAGRREATEEFQTGVPRSVKYGGL